MPSQKPILGRAQDIDDYTADGKKFVLTTRVECAKATQVINEETKEVKVLDSCLWYEARFALRQVDEKSGRKVGHVYSYCVNKTLQHANGTPIWIDEILTPHKNETVSELQMVFRELFTPRGNVRPQLRKHRGDLSADRILFVDGFLVNLEFRGTGLAQQGLQIFHSLLPEVSHGYGFTGPVVLSPAANEDQKNDSQKTDVEIENGLIRSYEKSRYEVWLKVEKDVEGSVTIMGGFVKGEHEQVDGDEDAMDIA